MNRAGELPLRPSSQESKMVIFDINLFKRSLTASVAVGFVAVCLSGCHSAAYKKRADRETNRILGKKVQGVDNVEWADVDITLPEPATLEGLGMNPENAEYLGKEAELESSAKMIPLDEALHLAIQHNRDYLTQKEVIFLQALNLTLTRHAFAPIFAADGDVTRQSGARTVDPEGVETEVIAIVAENTVSQNRHYGVSKLTKTGARIAADFTSDFLKFVIGDRQVNNSQLAVSVLQPILRGGGTTATMEALTQGERDLLYSLRDFANFRREFIVGIANDYYFTLQARDQVQNNWVAYQAFVKNVEREMALAEENRRTQTEIGQLRQALLNAESRWVNSLSDYKSQLDAFKITLGLPVDDNLVLDYPELKDLRIEDPGVSRNDAVEVALVTRPDLQTSKDQIVDAERGIKVAENGLLPGLDLEVNYDAISDPSDITPGLNLKRQNLSATIDLDLPFDRKEDRNVYRAALIGLEQAKRSDSLNFDNVRLQIYDDWRALEQAKRNYEISDLGVSLAVRRLDEQFELADLGRGEARDLVDAQTDLVNAQNQRTATLVTHTLARLRLWQNMGILYINKDGSWIPQLAEEGR
ncbi:TolC family protein [bacterium]|nr:TolC family protein [bacterium]